MSIQRVQRKNRVVWAVRWRDASGRQRSRVFDRKRDAAIFEAEVKRRARLGDLAAMDAGREPLDDYVTKTWGPSHAAHLAARTRQTYSCMYDRHISPELGGVPLREIDAERVAVFQGKLVRAGVGPHAIRKAMMLLGAILQRAAEGRRIAYNPQRVVRRVPMPMAPEVRPLAPITIERMRAAAASEREAAILSVLGYAGLRPGELRILRWGHVRSRTLLVTAEKTRRRRTVRLLEPLVEDLRAWRKRSGNPPDHALVFPGERGGVWSANAFEKWRRRRFAALLAAGWSRRRPAIRSPPLVRLAAAARGPGRDLRRASARARRRADAAHVRARDRGARGLAAVAGRGGDQAGARDDAPPGGIMCAFCARLKRRAARRSPQTALYQGAPSWIRTSGLLLRRESLYPAELSGHSPRDVNRCPTEHEIALAIFTANAPVQRVAGNIDVTCEPFGAGADEQLLGTG